MKSRPTRWGRFVAVGVLVLALLAGGLLASDAVWGVRHHWTVQTGRRTFRVPLGWRTVAPVYRPEGHDDHDGLELRRRGWGLLWGGAPDKISLRESAEVFDAVDRAQQWDRRETETMIPGERLEATPAASFLRDHARCSGMKRADDGSISFACFDQGGQWGVWYRGRRSGVRDLVRILESESEIPAAAR